MALNKEDKYKWEDQQSSVFPNFDATGWITKACVLGAAARPTGTPTPPNNNNIARSGVSTKVLALDSGAGVDIITNPEYIENRRPGKPLDILWWYTVD